MMPCSLQSVNGLSFSQSLHGASLPSNLQTLTCGYRINRSLNSVMLQSSLRSLTSGFRFYQNFRSVRSH